MTTQQNIELVAVGHVTIDRVGDDARLGGAAAYAALTARHLGVRAAVVTSAGRDFPYWDLFRDIHTKVVASDRTTELEHRYVDGVRQQRVLQRASSIRAGDLVGLPLVNDAAVLYCPVVDEIEARFDALAPKGLSAVAPQGFFRRWDARGHISIGRWDAAEEALAHADVVCMSEEDAEVPEELAESFPGRAFVITRGRDGCRVYAGADVFDFPALPAKEVDATGAGDVFAAAFVIALRQGALLPDAIRSATREAAASVEYVGVEGLT